MRSLRAAAAVKLEVPQAPSALKVEPLESNASPNGAEQVAKSAEHDKRKRSMTSTLTSPPSKKQATASMTEDNKGDPTILRIQNQQLSQQLELHRERIQDLESRLKGLEHKQTSYDANLITVNRIWDQLIDDLGILAVKAGGTLNGSNGVTSPVEDSKEDAAEMTGDLFLRRLLQACPKVEPIDGASDENLLEQALEARSSQTVKILRSVVAGIEGQRRRNDDLLECVKRQAPEKDALRSLESNESALRDEVERTRGAIDELHVKHRALLSEVAVLRDVRLKKQSEVKALSEQLEDTQSELQSAKKKLALLKHQLEAARSGNGSGAFGTTRSASKSDLANGDACRVSSEEVEKLRGSLDEAQRLASRRLEEINAANQEHLQLLRKARELEAALQDEQRIRSTRAYAALADQLSASRDEADRLRAMVEAVQRERNASVMREKDLFARAESGDFYKRACSIAETRIKDLESRLRDIFAERNSFGLRVAELEAQAKQMDTVDEMKVMLASAQREMGLLQEQLRKYKEMAEKVPAVRAENKSLQEVLLRKAAEHQDVRAKYSATLELLKQQEEEMRNMKGTELELRMFVDMYARESLDRREVREVKEAEVRALAEVERLRGELKEHALAQRAKAASEAEAACQQRLVAAEATTARLHEQLDEAEKKCVELQEAMKAKTEEGEVYMSEIETISQAYEEMQSQNKRLLQQISQRDQFNMQLTSESVREKQEMDALRMAKTSSEERAKSAASAAALDKQRIQQLDEQIKALRVELERALEEGRKAQADAEAARKQQTEAEREATTLKRAAVESERDNAARDQKLAEAEEQAEKERQRVLRLEEDKAMLVKRLQKAEASEKGSSSTALAVEDLQEELKDYKNLVMCGICHHRKKEVVITKCFHLFCSPCVQRNLEIRHRKCPGCGTAFGSGDVHPVYL